MNLNSIMETSNHDVKLLQEGIKFFLEVSYDAKDENGEIFGITMPKISIIPKFSVKDDKKDTRLDILPDKNGTMIDILKLGDVL